MQESLGEVCWFQSLAMKAPGKSVPRQVEGAAEATMKWFVLDGRKKYSHQTLSIETPKLGFEHDEGQEGVPVVTTGAECTDELVKETRTCQAPHHEREPPYAENPIEQC